MTEWASASDLDDFEVRIEAAKIIGIRGQHPLSCTTSADDDMSVDDVGCPRGRQEPPDVRRVHPVEGDDIGVRLADQAGKADLALGPPDRLSQCSRGQGETSPHLGGSRQEHDDRAIIPVDSDQAPGVESDPRSHAAEDLVALSAPRMRSAQDRSSSVRSPPLWLNASASSAPHPATSSSETETAC